MIMTPNSIEMLIHCHVSPLPHPRRHAPWVAEDMKTMQENGLIEPEPGSLGGFRTTERGQAHIAQLCRLGLPARVWVGADGTKILGSAGPTAALGGGAAALPDRDPLAGAQIMTTFKTGQTTTHNIGFAYPSSEIAALLGQSDEGCYFLHAHGKIAAYRTYVDALAVAVEAGTAPHRLSIDHPDNAHRLPAAP